jgi:hypothetical protein
VGWLAVLLVNLTGIRPYGALLVGPATVFVFWQLARTADDRHSTTWFRVGAMLGGLATGLAVLAVAAPRPWAVAALGSVGSAALLVFACGMGRWSRASGWPQSARRYHRSAALLVLSWATIGMALVLASPLTGASADDMESGMFIAGRRVTGAAATFGTVGIVALLAGLLLMAYANAGISQVHRPPPWWRRRRGTKTSGPDAAVPMR